MNLHALCRQRSRQSVPGYMDFVHARLHIPRFLCDPTTLSLCPNSAWKVNQNCTVATAFVLCWPSAKSACRTGAAEFDDTYGFCWIAERGCRDALGLWAASCGGKAGD